MKKDQLILGGTLVGLAIYVFIFFQVLLSPKIAEIKKVTGEIEAAKRELTNAQLMQARLPELKYRTQVLQKQIAFLEQKLPRSANRPDFIKTISRAAQLHGIRMNTLSPQGEDTSSPQVTEMMFSINFNASIHALGKFLADLAQGDRIIVGRDLVVSASQDKVYPISGSCVIYAFTVK